MSKSFLDYFSGLPFCGALHYFPPVGLNNGINVRLDSEMRARLKKIAERAGVKSSLLIRQAIVEMLDYVEASGSITMPLARGGKYPARQPDPFRLNDKTKGT